jgi:transposase-like protein
MPPVCTLCRRPDRAEIDALLIVPAEPLRNIAKRYGTSPATLLRHKDHLPRALAVATEAAVQAQADTLARQVRDLQEHADRLRAQAEATGDIRAALMAGKTLSDLVELLLKVRAAEREAERPTMADLRRKAERASARTGVPVEEIIADALAMADELD